jgi:hypothetical protein
MVASPLLGIEPQFNTSAYGNFESENTHDIDDENVMDAFSYSYYKTPLSFIDGTYVRDTLDYPSLFPFIFNTFNQDENTKKITDYAYVQYVNVSPSI